FANTQSRIVKSSLLRHLIKQRVGNPFTKRPMLDRIRLRLHRIRHVACVSRVNRQRQLIRMSLLGDGVEQSGVETVEDPASSARFKNSLDAIHSLLLQFVDLLPGLVAGGGDARELFFQIGASCGWKILEILRTVPTVGGEQRAARGQVRAQNLASAHWGSHLESDVQTISDTSHRSDATVEI